MTKAKKPRDKMASGMSIIGDSTNTIRYSLSLPIPPSPFRQFFFMWYMRELMTHILVTYQAQWKHHFTNIYGENLGKNCPEWHQLPHTHPLISLAKEGILWLGYGHPYKIWMGWVGLSQLQDYKKECFSYRKDLPYHSMYTIIKNAVDYYLQ